MVLAAGWRPAEIKGEAYAHLGFGEIADVVTNPSLKKCAKQARLSGPRTARKPSPLSSFRARERADDSDFEYAGAVTSLVSLKQAKYVRDDYADGKAFIFYQHMRTPGLRENFYKGIQQDPGIFLTKGNVVQVSKNGRRPHCRGQRYLAG